MGCLFSVRDALDMDGCKAFVFLRVLQTALKQELPGCAAHVFFSFWTTVNMTNLLCFVSRLTISCNSVYALPFTNSLRQGRCPS